MSFLSKLVLYRITFLIRKTEHDHFDAIVLSRLYDKQTHLSHFHVSISSQS